MSSDLLRRAAEKLRTTAAKATPGPWERPLDVRYKNVVTAAKPDDEQGRYLDGRPERVSVVQLNTWSDGTFMRKRGGRDLEWIALASPVIAEPLARWLEDVATALEFAATARPDVHPPADLPALLIARAVLGEEAR